MTERKMKDSGIPWIGMIPEEWEVAESKFLVKINPGSDPKTEGDIPVYGSGSTSFRTCGEYKNGPAVLVGRKGTINIPQYVVGKYWNVDTAFDVMPKAYDIRLYYYMAQCFDYEYYQTSTAVPSMTQGDYARMMLPIPSHNEQVAIASWLDEKCGEIDELIEIEQKMIVELEAYRQAIFTETVTRGLNPDAPMRQTGISWIPEIPEHWEMCRLKYLCDRMQSGDALTSLQINSSGKYMVYGGNGLRGYYENSNFSGEAIIIGRQGALCGNVHYINNSIWATDHAVITTQSAKSNIKYLYYLTLGMNLNQYASQTAAQPGLAVGQIKNVLTVVPPLAEQQAIADYLDIKCKEIDELIAVKREKIETLKQYRQSIIFEAVTGKIQIN